MTRRREHYAPGDRPSAIPLVALVALALPAVLAGPAAAQIVTPRGRVAAVYKQHDMESSIVAEVEPNGRWRLDFSGAEVPVRLPEESAAATRSERSGQPVAMKVLLPARDNGFSVLARVKGPGKKNEGWVDPEKVEISPDPAWKIPAATLLFVPMKVRQVPPVKAAAIPVAAQGKSGAYLLLIDPEGKVAGVRPLEGAAEPALENALLQFRFVPMRFEGEPVHVLLAVRVESRNDARGESRKP